MYFIYGNEEYFIKKEISKIIKNNRDAELLAFSEESDFIALLNEIQSIDIFANKKIILLENFCLLNSKDKNKINEFIDALKNSTNNSIIIITELLKETSTKKTKEDILRDFLLKNTNAREFKKLQDKDLGKYIKEIVEKKGGQISYSTAMNLSTKLPNNLFQIVREIDKLMQRDKTITDEIIEIAIDNTAETDSFAFVNAFSNNNFDSLWFNYLNKIEEGETITSLIGQISSILILAADVYSYRKANYSTDEIVSRTKIHIFRIKKAIDFVSTIGIWKIHKLIAILSQLDREIKSGKIDEKIGFENFLLQSFR